MDEELKTPLGNEILFGELTRGGRVLVDLNEDGELTFSYAEKSKGS